MTITNSSVTLKGVKTEGDQDARNLLEYTQKVQRSLQDNPDTFIDLSAFDNVAQPEDTLNTKLSHISEKFLAERKKANISSDQLNKIRVAHDMLIEIVGDKYIHAVTDADVEKTKELLSEVPKFRTNTPLYKGKSLKECIALAKKHGKGTLHATTVDQNLQKMSGLFDWAIKKRYLKSLVNAQQKQAYLDRQWSRT